MFHPAPKHGGQRSLPKQVFEVAFPMNHAKNENVLAFDAINDNVLTHGEAARPDAEIVVADTSRVREAGEEKETVGNPVNQPGGNIHVAAFRCHVKPDLVKIGFSLSGYTVRH